MEPDTKKDMDEKQPTNTTPVSSNGSIPPAPAEPEVEKSVETTSPAASSPTTPVTPPAAHAEPAMTPLTTPTTADLAAPVAVFPLKQYLIAAAIVVVIGLILLFGLERQGRIDTNIFGSVSALVMPEKAAAIVNGEKITMSQYENNRDQLIVSAQQQGLDPTNESILDEINTQAIDVLINTELLRQSATAAGIVITDEAIEARYQEVLTSVGGEEELATRMAEIGIDEAALREDIRGELLIQNHLETAIDRSSITVEESEVTAVYEQAGGEAAGLPPLADVREQIEAQIRFAQEQELVNAYLQTLRDAATIEVLI